MALPAGAYIREGVAYSAEGALLVQAVAGSGIPVVLAQSWAAVSVPADATEDTLATITVPANTLGANGALRVTTQWSYTNSVNNKTMRIRYSGAAGTIYMAIVATTTVSYYDVRTIANRGLTNSQIGFVAGSSILTLSGGSAVTSAVDTTAATSLVITGQKASSGETLTLEGYLVEVVKP